MKRLHSLKSTHWVMWSSPLLLLVLVLTLSASSAPRPSASKQVGRATTTTLVDTAAPTTSTTTTSLALRSKKQVTLRHATQPVATSTTTLRRVVDSSSATASNVKSIANAPAETVASGALSGQLNPSFGVADVPLEGPGSWFLATSSTANTTLQCPARTMSIQSTINLGANERCQLIITTTQSARSLTWQLTPAR